MDSIAKGSLGGDERLALGGDRLGGSDDRILSGRRREFGLLRHGGRLGGGGGGAAAATQHLLNLARVVTGVLLAHGGKVAHLLLSDASDLLSLRVDGVGGVLEVGIDELLVASVDQGHNEGGGSSNQSETPERDELHEVVRDEGSDASLYRLSGGSPAEILGTETGFLQQQRPRCSRQIGYAELQ